MFCHWSLLSSGVYVAWFCACECESWIIRAQNNVDTGIWKKEQSSRNACPFFVRVTWGTAKNIARIVNSLCNTPKATLDSDLKQQNSWSSCVTCWVRRARSPRNDCTDTLLCLFPSFFFPSFFNFFNYFYLPGQDRKRRHRERGEQKIDFRVSDRIEWGMGWGGHRWFGLSTGGGGRWPSHKVITSQMTKRYWVAKFLYWVTP